MERERSLSNSSADSWSLVEDEENHDALENDGCFGVGMEQQPDSLSNVNTLPLDLSSALLPQYLILVQTPASSSSLVTPSSDAILSSKQSAEALLASDHSAPESPLLLSPPPKSPPLESTFTFLKDPKLRISFSSSSESKEEEEKEEESAEVEQHKDNVNELMLADLEQQQTGEEKGAALDLRDALDDDDDDEGVVVEQQNVVDVISNGKKQDDFVDKEEGEPKEEELSEQTDEINVVGMEQRDENSEEIVQMVGNDDGIGEVKETADAEPDDDHSVVKEDQQKMPESELKKTAMMVIQIDDEEEEESNLSDKYEQQQSYDGNADGNGCSSQDDNTSHHSEIVSAYGITPIAEESPTTIPSLPCTQPLAQLPPSIFDFLETTSITDNCSSSTILFECASSSSSFSSSTTCSSATTASGGGSGWTELSSSWTSTCTSLTSSTAGTTEEAMAFSLIDEAKNGKDESNNAITTGNNMNVMDDDPAVMVARRLDKLSEQTALSSWQRSLRDTMIIGTLTKNLEHGMADRIINVLIVAMFLTSLSSMTILHILEYSWMGNNGGTQTSSFSSSIGRQESQKHHNDYYHRGMMNTKLPFLLQHYQEEGQLSEMADEGHGLNEQQQQHEQQLLEHFRADSNALDDKWNIELRQCQDELLETRHAYESKAKLLHYVRFKEMEQEAIVNELRRELEQAKMALEQIVDQQNQHVNLPISQHQPTPSMSEISPILITDNIDERHLRSRGRRGPLAEKRKKKQLAFAQKMAQYGEEETVQEGRIFEIYPPPPVLLAPDPQFLRTQLIAPPAALTSYLTPPPVRTRKQVGKRQEQQTHDQAYADDDVRQIYTEGYYSDDEEENGNSPKNCAIPDRREQQSNVQNENEQMETKKDGKTEASDGFFSGHLFLSNWRKYNEILQNLSTHTGRTQMLRTVRNAMVARLNRTIEKTTSALSAATKLMVAENFGKNLFKSKMKQWMAQMEPYSAGWSTLMKTLSGGANYEDGRRIPCFEEEEDKSGHKFAGRDEERQKHEQQGSKEEEQFSEVNEKEFVQEGEESRQVKQAEHVPVCTMELEMKPSVYESTEYKKKQEQHAQRQSGEEKKTDAKWHLQRATVRAQLRRRQQQMRNGNNGSTTEQANIHFARWLFARAALRQRQRELQNDTAADDWFFARQKMRAKLRAEHIQSDWLFVRQRLRDKARQREDEEDNKQNENSWFFTRQKVRQKFRGSWKSLKKSTRSTPKKAKEELEKLRVWWNEHYGNGGGNE